MPRHPAKYTKPIVRSLVIEAVPIVVTLTDTVIAVRLKGQHSTPWRYSLANLFRSAIREHSRPARRRRAPRVEPLPQEEMPLTQGGQS